MLKELAKFALFAVIGLAANFIYPAPHVPKQYVPVLWAVLAAIVVIWVLKHRQRFDYTCHAEPWLDEHDICHVPPRDPGK